MLYFSFGEKRDQNNLLHFQNRFFKLPLIKQILLKFAKGFQTALLEKSKIKIKEM